MFIVQPGRATLSVILDSRALCNRDEIHPTLEMTRPGCLVQQHRGRPGTRVRRHLEVPTLRARHGLCNEALPSPASQRSRLRLAGDGLLSQEALEVGEDDQTSDEGSHGPRWQTADAAISPRP